MVAEGNTSSENKRLLETPDIFLRTESKVTDSFSKSNRSSSETTTVSK